MNNGSSRDRRDSHRHEARIKIRFATPEALEKEYTTNLGKGGLFINTRKPRPLRSRIKFQLILPVSNKILELTGEVVHVVEALPGQDTSTTGVGVQFIDLTREKRDIIEKYIANIDSEGKYHEPDESPEDEPESQQLHKPVLLKEALRKAAREMEGLSPEQLLELRRKFKLFYVKRAKLNHYDLLGAGYTATPQEIRDAYHKLSMEFHPDRHSRGLPPELQVQLEDIFGRINRSYKILRNTPSRLEYDVSVGNWGSVEGVPELSEEAKRACQMEMQYKKEFPEKVEKAKAMLKKAENLLAGGDEKGAAIQLKLAYSYNPYNEQIKSMIEKLGIIGKPSKGKKNK